MSPRVRLLLIAAVVVVVAVAVLGVQVVRHGAREDEWTHGGDGVEAAASIEASTVRGFGDLMVEEDCLATQA